MVHYSPVDRTFAAVADPTRRAVLERLGQGTATISELAEPFGMSLTGMKKHVRILEEAQLVATVKVGRTRLCHLGPRRLDDVRDWVEIYRQMVNEQLDRFGALLDRTKGDRSDRRPEEPPRRQAHQAERSGVPRGARLRPSDRARLGRLHGPGADPSVVGPGHDRGPLRPPSRRQPTGSSRTPAPTRRARSSATSSRSPRRTVSSRRSAWKGRTATR